MHTFKEFVEKNYTQIKRRIECAAFKNFINKDDFVSFVNEKLAKIISSNPEIDKDRFLAYTQIMIKHAVINYKELSLWIHRASDIDNEYDYSETNQPDFEISDLLKNICYEISLMNKKDKNKIFEAYFFDGLQYPQIAVLLKIPPATVRKRLFKTRELIKLKYGNTYKQLIAA